MNFLRKQPFILTVLTSIAFLPNAYGADFVVSTPTTTQNGAAGNIINGSDTLLITETGSITTVGVNAVSATGNVNIINNEGVISTTGTAIGIRSVGNSNTIINNGATNTTGSNSHGFSITGNSNGVTNNGFIRTSGTISNGILLGGNTNSIINNGTIRTTGINSRGIDDSGVGNSILNSGSINTLTFGINHLGTNGIIINGGNILSNGTSGVGIRTGTSASGNIVTNNGSILTTGLSAEGIIVQFNGNVVNNNGTIRGIGVGNTAISVLGGTANIINNSGLAVGSTTSLSSSGGNTFNLLAPSFLGGAFALTNDTVTITTGPSQSVLWDFTGSTLVGGAPTINGPAPFFYNAATQQFATYDPTVFTALRDQLADVSGSASLLIQTRLDNTCGASRRGNIWVSTFGSTYKYGMTSATLDYHFKYWGVVAGYDKMLYNNLIIGAFGGYGKGFLNSDAKFVQSLDNEADGAILGVYGRKNAGILFVDLGFSFGTLKHKDSRFVNDNLAPLGESNATSSHDGFWLCPEIAIGANLKKFDTWTISPNARYRYAWETIDSYTESGSASNASVPNQKIAVGEFKGELAAKKRMNFGCVSGRVGYLLRNRLGNDSTSVTMIAQTVSIPVLYNHRNAGYIGLDAEFNIGRSSKFNIGGELTGGGGIKGMKGEVALITTF